MKGTKRKVKDTTGVSDPVLSKEVAAEAEGTQTPTPNNSKKSKKEQDARSSEDSMPPDQHGDFGSKKAPTNSNSNSNNSRNLEGSKEEEEKDTSIPVAVEDGVGSGSEVPMMSMISDGKYRNKQRCLVVCSRGVTARYRHLLQDLRTLMPHHKKESKLDAGEEGLGRAVTDVALLRSCNSFLFLECRKKQDCYMWLSSRRRRKNGDGGDDSFGPSVKFLVSNIHTMDELRLTGNCLKGSRPLLSFDESFDRMDHLRLLKGLFVDIFGVPRGHPKSKPFVDRIMSFYFADGRIWVRNYQILEQSPANAQEAHAVKKDRATATSLVEIGPRFVLNPIRIFQGSFGGPTLYQNPSFVSPNAIRALEKRKQGSVYKDRKRARDQRRERQEQLVLPDDPLDSVFA